jgi:hypothetical protein
VHSGATPVVVWAMRGECVRAGGWAAQRPAAAPRRLHYCCHGEEGSSLQPSCHSLQRLDPDPLGSALLPRHPISPLSPHAPPKTTQQEAKHWEDAFKVYEKGVALFK